MTTFTVTLQPTLALTDEQFEQVARDNRDLKFERTATGELLIMAPTGGETGNLNFKLYAPFWASDPQEQLGYFFDSSTAFKLPNNAIRSPDVSWVRRDRWEALTPEQRRKFPPLCPDFALELRSVTDSLKSLQDKMQEYLDNGLRLGWLIDPQTQQVEIYRAPQATEILKSPVTLSGEEVLQGFVLNLRPIFAVLQKEMEEKS